MNSSPTNAHALPPKFRLKIKIPIPSPIPSLAVDEDDWDQFQSRPHQHGLPSPVSTTQLFRNVSPLPAKPKRIRLAYKSNSGITPTTKTPSTPTPVIHEPDLDDLSYQDLYHKPTSTAPDCKSNFLNI